jgi:Cu/Ag efflux protein CusF
MGIVRAVLPKEGIVIITHEPFGTMPAMTMGFRAKDRRIMTGLAPGDRVEFTVARAGKDLELIELHTER